MRAFFERNTAIVAFELIGKVLVFQKNQSALQGRIVETEAYFGKEDSASHAYNGPTRRTQVMFGPPGVSYVYFTYGNHHCLNVVTEKNETAGAVLIRAVEPLKGIDMMKENRHKNEIRDLTNGPGKLCQAFGITREHSGKNLISEDFFIADSHSDAEPLHIKATTRIGISKAKEKLFRFYLMSSPFVSVR